MLQADGDRALVVSCCLFVALHEFVCFRRCCCVSVVVCQSLCVYVFVLVCGMNVCCDGGR